MKQICAEFGAALSATMRRERIARVSAPALCVGFKTLRFGTLRNNLRCLLHPCRCLAGRGQC